MINVAIVGATGLVGRTILNVLEEKKLSYINYTLFSSKKSAGSILNFMNKDYIVNELTENTFIKTHFDYAIFSAGADIALKYAPIAIQNNCIVIDNSSAFRMHSSVPLVVPEVNKKDIFNHQGIISNPNCSTIQAVLPLKALSNKYKIKRVIYSTYQAVSGAGKQGIEDYKNGILGIPPCKFPYPIFNNCLPHIDMFLENGYTKEEEKMINETKKILHNPNLNITATCVRVPLENCHCESINIEFEDDINMFEINKAISNFPNISVIDNIKSNLYPIPTNITGKDNVYVGRIRRDYSVKNGINIWVVADNIRKGAATNAVQIFECLLK